MQHTQIVDIKKSIEGFNLSIADISKAYDNISFQIEQYKRSKILPGDYLKFMAGNLAHEIRNPLSIISATVELLVETDKASGAETISNILSGVRRIDKIVENLIVFGRPIALKPIKCNFCDLLNEAIKSVELEAEAKDKLLLSYQDHTSGQLYTKMDPILMRQAVRNVIINAIESAKEAPQISIHLCVKNKSFEIKVSDNGGGLPGGNGELPFYPFFTTKTYGMGLGLPTSKRIIEEHGGNIALQDRNADGVDVIINLPKN